MPRPKTKQQIEPCRNCDQFACCKEHKLACTAMLEYVHKGKTDRKPGVPLHLAYSFIFSGHEEPPSKIEYIIDEVESALAQSMTLPPAQATTGLYGLSS